MLTRGLHTWISIRLRDGNINLIIILHHIMFYVRTYVNYAEGTKLRGTSTHACMHRCMFSLVAYECSKGWNHHSIRLVYMSSTNCHPTFMHKYLTILSKRYHHFTFHWRMVELTIISCIWISRDGSSGFKIHQSIRICNDLLCFMPTILKIDTWFHRLHNTSKLHNICILVNEIKMFRKRETHVCIQVFRL